MELKPEHVIEIEGKQYVLFAGLLDVAHQIGIESISTHLVQTPNGDIDNEMAVVQATVAMDGNKTFSAYGDAAPNNCTKRTANALIRMAETRAVGRALRFATNIAMTSVEELGGDAPAPAAPALPPGRAKAIAEKVVGDDDLPFEGDLRSVPGSAAMDPNLDGSDPRYPLRAQTKATARSIEWPCRFCGNTHIEVGQRVVGVWDPNGKMKVNDKTGKDEHYLIWGDIACYNVWLDE